MYRRGTFEEDVVQLASEAKPAGSERLLKPVVIDGEIVPGSLPPLSEIWEFAQTNLRKLPEEYHQLIEPKSYPVRLSTRLQALRTRVIAEHRENGRVPSEPAEAGTHA